MSHSLLLTSFVRGECNQKIGGLHAFKMYAAAFICVPWQAHLVVVGALEPLVAVDLLLDRQAQSGDRQLVCIQEVWSNSLSACYGRRTWL